MSTGFKKSLIAVSISGLMVSSAAFATNGMFGHGYSTKEKGLAGAGAAYSQDSLAAATNPAGMVQVGNRMDVGAALFNPNRNYDVTGGPSNACSAAGCSFSIGPQGIESDSTLFLIPHFGYNSMLDDSSSVGVSVYGNGGMNTRYKGGTATYFDSVNAGDFVTVPGTFGGAVGPGLSGTTGVDLKQLFIAGTYAKKLTSDHSVGASLIFAYQTFKADGVSSLGAFSSNPGKLSNNGDDTSTGFGAKLGWQGKVAPSVTLGASYQTKMAMSEFDDYAGLFAEQGGFDIPATLVLGAAWSINDTSKLIVDIQSIYYSDVPSLGNSITPLLDGSCVPNPATGGAGAGCLGGSDGAGFG
jgi:long-chain fatty acid transport protein